MDTKSVKMQKRARDRIPGGTQLLSKRPEMFAPEQWPGYYSRAKGVFVWDLDGRKYTDMSISGIGANILGFADPDVDAAVRKAIAHGTSASFNCPEEIVLADLLCSIHRWAHMVRYARCGGESMTIAVRIARAKSGRDRILFCGYHGWHDWYLSANLADDKALDGHLLPGLEPKGVPRALRGTAIPFRYNDTKGFLDLVNRYKDGIAAVVMEPIRNYYPAKGFLETIREVTARRRIVLIFDEITSGWRLCLGGAHLKFGVHPDICVFAKAISNGYPMAAVIGRKEVMDVAQDTFISSTYWTERIGPVAALATIKKLKEKKVATHLAKIGRRMQEGWSRLAKRHKLDITVSGIYPLGHFDFNYREPLVLKTLFTQSMLEKGFLATTAFYASFSHKDKYLDSYLEAADAAFALIAKAVREGRPARYLKGPVCHTAFKRLT